MDTSAPDARLNRSFFMRCDDDFLSKLAELRRAEPAILNKSDMVRALVERAHEHLLAAQSVARSAKRAKS